MSEVKENQWNKNFVNYIEENIFYKADGKALRRQCDVALVDELKKDLEFSKDSTILDFACGTGRLVSLLKENDIDIKQNYQGYDSSEAMIEKANRTPKFSVRQRNRCKLCGCAWDGRTYEE